MTCFEQDSGCHIAYEAIYWSYSISIDPYFANLTDLAGRDHPPEILE